MKRFLTLLLAACLLAACGCRAAGTAQGGTAPDAPPPDGAATLSATIVSVEQDGLLLAGSGAYEGVYRVGIKDVPVLLNGQPADAAALRAGRTVEITFDGAMAECYPAIPSGVTRIVVTEAEIGPVALYLQVFDDLMEMDTALSEDIRYIGVDLSTVNNLSESERDAVCWRLGERYGAEPVAGTFDALCDAGYIDRKALYWEDGVFLQIELTEAGEDALAFDAQKWRSGLGANFFEDCTARRTAAGWTYEVGALAVS